MNPWFETSSPFVAGAAWLALSLLLVHAIRTHGWLFAVIWLVLPAALITLLVEWLPTYPSTPPIRDGIIAIPPNHARLEATVFLVDAFYLAALLAKGFVERTRLAGSPLTLAVCAAIFGIPFVSGWIANAEVGEKAWVRAWGDGDCGICNQPGWDPPFPLPSGFAVAWIVALGSFVLSYRLISLRTSNNGVKAIVLLVLLPIFALAGRVVANAT